MTVPLLVIGIAMDSRIPGCFELAVERPARPGGCQPEHSQRISATRWYSDFKMR